MNALMLITKQVFLLITELNDFNTFQDKPKNKPQQI